MDEDLGGLGQVPLQVTAKPRVVIQEAEQDRRAPLARDGQHPVLAVMEVGVPEPVAARDFVAQHLARLDPRLGLFAQPPAPAPAPANQPAIAHHPGQGRVGRHRAETRLGLDPRPQIVVVQLRRPRRMGPVLIQQRRNQLRGHRTHAAGVGARPPMQGPDRVLIRHPRPVIPPLNGRSREAHRPPAGRMLPAPLRQALQLGPAGNPAAAEMPVPARPRQSASAPTGPDRPGRCCFP